MPPYQSSNWSMTCSIIPIEKNFIELVIEVDSELRCAEFAVDITRYKPSFYSFLEARNEWIEGCMSSSGYCLWRPREARSCGAHQAFGEVCGGIKGLGKLV